MIGILILAHEDIGKGLLDAATHMLGKRPERVEALPVSYDHSPEEIIRLLNEGIARCDLGQGVLILADIYGATHTNAACRLLKRGYIEMITGVNLPMLVRVLNYRHQSLEDLIDKALGGGSGGIVCAARPDDEAEARA